MITFAERAGSHSYCIRHISAGGSAVWLMPVVGGPSIRRPSSADTCLCLVLSTQLWHALESSHPAMSYTGRPALWPVLEISPPGPASVDLSSHGAAGTVDTRCQHGKQIPTGSPGAPPRCSGRPDRQPGTAHGADLNPRPDPARPGADQPGSTRSETAGADGPVWPATPVVIRRPCAA